MHTAKREAKVPPHVLIKHAAYGETAEDAQVRIVLHPAQSVRARRREPVVLRRGHSLLTSYECPAPSRQIKFPEIIKFPCWAW